MASSSSSRPTQEKYDVFLSFRGEDTRKGFTSHLHAALCRTKIKTFIDDELERGDEISPSLLYAIEGSKISIVIFSKDYASSRWCLQELVKIMDRKKMHGQIVIPVFYDVNPSDVRKQTGTYGDAFANHEVRYRHREEMLRGWRSALTEAANLPGFHSNDVRSESILVDRITEQTLNRLKAMSSVDNEKNLIGIAMKIQEIKSLLSDGPKEARKVGIWGMGGIGKTTLAYAVFNDISGQFEASCFIENVREASEKGELSRLRKKLIFTILEDKHLNIRLTSTKERLGRKRVLIVFDDVTDLKQINKLIGDLDYVGVGSRIIITTRDKHVLKTCGLDDVTIYEIKGLYSDESLQLFKQYAFKQNHRIEEDYMKLSNRVINYTKGVPLAIEVLGCFLFGREKIEWESALDELENSPNETIQTVLKISYDGLDRKEKDLFLDIVCFFNGWDKDLVSIFSPDIKIGVLVDKALITISYKTIRIHDLLQKMGREIVRQEPVDKLGQLSRLWHCKDVYRVLKKNLGTETVRGICCDMNQIREINLNPYAFSKMHNLRFLIVKNSYWIDNNKVHDFEGIEFDFRELRCLYWNGYPCTLLPSNFDPENLVVLKMRNSNLKQLWTGIKDLPNLKYIDLSYSKHLLKVPDLSKAPNLESLILEGCTSLFEITPPSQNLNKLVFLNLRYCETLISLPFGIQSMSLKVVILSGCSKLKTAPKISCNMERLFLDGTAIKELSSSIDYPTRLVELNLKGCSRLESLPRSIFNLSSLKWFNLSGLSNLKIVPGIPCNIEGLFLDGTAKKELSSPMDYTSRLVELNLKGCSWVESLPSSICNLRSLQLLNLSGLSNLKMFPVIPRNTEELILDGTAIRELPSSIKNASSLVRLSLKGCSWVESLPSSICNLRSLQLLNLSGLSNLKMVPEIPRNTKELILDGTAIRELPSSIETASSPVSLSHKNCLSLKNFLRLESFPNVISSKGYYDLDWGMDFSALNEQPLSHLEIASDGYYDLDWNEVGMVLNDALLDTHTNRTVALEVQKKYSSPFEKRMVGRGCMFFPGSEIPEWFDIQINGSCIELPHGSFNYRFLGFVVCAIVGFQDYVSSGFYTNGASYELCLKVENGWEKFTDDLLVTTNIKSDQVFVGYNFLLSKFREFTCCTEAIINFDSMYPIIKKCGVRLFFNQEFEEPMERSICSIIDEEEAHSKRLKSSNFFKEKS